MENALKIFEHPEFGTVRTIIEEDGEPWFYAQDVAIALGYSATGAMNKTIAKEDKKIITQKMGKNHTKQSIVSKNGLYFAICNTQNISSAAKISTLNWFQKNKLLPKINPKQPFTLKPRLETEFVDMLDKVLEPLGVRGRRQYNVNNYRIDYYIPSLKIAIEYDENGHMYYDQEKEAERETAIADALNSKFIRVSNFNSHYWNIGKVISEIFAMACNNFHTDKLPQV